MESKLYTLVETELFSWMLGRLAPIPEADQVLMDLTWAIARLAPDLPLVAGSTKLRYILSMPLLDDDGVIIRLMIRFLLRDKSTVELLTVESLAEA